MRLPGDGGYGGTLQLPLGPVQIKELEVRLRGLPPELAGFRLVQISDVHIGALLRRLCDRLSRDFGALALNVAA